MPPLSFAYPRDVPCPSAASDIVEKEKTVTISAIQVTIYQGALRGVFLGEPSGIVLLG